MKHALRNGYYVQARLLRDFTNISRAVWNVSAYETDLPRSGLSEGFCSSHHYGVKQ